MHTDETTVRVGAKILNDSVDDVKDFVDKVLIHSHQPAGVVAVLQRQIAMGKKLIIIKMVRDARAWS